MRLIEHNQFDTVYHEHFSYLSLYTVAQIFEAAGLRIWDVEELRTHGGSSTGAMLAQVRRPRPRSARCSPKKRGAACEPLRFIDGSRPRPTE